MADNNTPPPLPFQLSEPVIKLLNKWLIDMVADAKKARNECLKTCAHLDKLAEHLTHSTFPSDMGSKYIPCSTYKSTLGQERIVEFQQREMAIMHEAKQRILEECRIPAAQEVSNLCKVAAAQYNSHEFISESLTKLCPMLFHCPLERDNFIKNFTLLNTAQPTTASTPAKAPAAMDVTVSVADIQAKHSKEIADLQLQLSKFQLQNPPVRPKSKNSSGPGNGTTKPPPQQQRTPGRGKSPSRARSRSNSSRQPQQSKQTDNRNRPSHNANRSTPRAAAASEKNPRQRSKSPGGRKQAHAQLHN